MNRVERGRVSYKRTSTVRQTQSRLKQELVVTRREEPLIVKCIGEDICCDWTYIETLLMFFYRNVQFADYW